MHMAASNLNGINKKGIKTTLECVNVNNMFIISPFPHDMIWYQRSYQQVLTCLCKYPAGWIGDRVVPCGFRDFTRVFILMKNSLLPPGTSLWQTPEGEPSCHTAYRRPPQSYSEVIPYCSPWCPEYHCSALLPTCHLAPNRWSVEEQL